jgi:hypothetical protein
MKIPLRLSIPKDLNNKYSKKEVDVHLLNIHRENNLIFN